MQGTLPGGWRLSPPSGPIAATGTMPQGIALSPDGSVLAVVEAGDNPPALRLLDAQTLALRKIIPLKDAFGTPVWLDASRVAVPGAGTGAAAIVDTGSGSVQNILVHGGSWPDAVAFSAERIALADDAGGTLTLAPWGAGGAGTPLTVRVGDHPGAVLFSRDGTTAYVSLRGRNDVIAVDAAQGRVVADIAVGRHPGAMALSADGLQLFVAESDDDSVGVVDTRTNRRVADIPVGIARGRVRGYGANPNALLLHGGTLFVSLGGENAVAVIRGGKVVEDIPAGWYPTGLALTPAGTLLISDGKGERAPPNPAFSRTRRDLYVASITIGSVRAVPARVYDAQAVQTQAELADLAPRWHAPRHTILRAHGPIAHVIYVIKENRSYDQVLGDFGAKANGDPAIVWFGRQVTPNQHAIAQRFGIFDNAYTDAQVSADGHNWTDAATANDYVERFWPPNYGNRRPVYDFQNGEGADVPHSGYLWDAAARARLRYRDYGEDTEPGNGPVPFAVTDHPGLQGHYDPRFVGWNLKYSDSNRFAEWKREFDGFVAHRDLPQLEIVYFPNDHTAGTQRGMPTPQAYVATNDWAVGRLVDAVSHSPYWKSTAIFILEDDAQNGPDHVSDQRSTFYIASPYARGGVQAAHYSTVSFVRTIELLLGLPPMSVDDATALPLYAAFGTKPLNCAPFLSVRPRTNLDATNAAAAYGSAQSAKLDFSRPDAVNPAVLNAILERAARPR